MCGYLVEVTWGIRSLSLINHMLRRVLFRVVELGFDAQLVRRICSVERRTTRALLH